MHGHGNEKRGEETVSLDGFLRGWEREERKERNKKREKREREGKLGRGGGGSE